MSGRKTHAVDWAATAIAAAAAAAAVAVPTNTSTSRKRRHDSTWVEGRPGGGRRRRPKVN